MFQDLAATDSPAVEEMLDSIHAGVHSPVSGAEGGTNSGDRLVAWYKASVPLQQTEAFPMRRLTLRNGIFRLLGLSGPPRDGSVTR